MGGDKYTGLALALIIVGCGPSKGSEQATAPKPTYKPIGEYKGIRFGSSFEDVIGSVDADLFNPYSLKECFHDIALAGCGLSRNSDDTMFDMRSGIPYALSLDFNRADKLTDIGLNYHREKSITGQQCRNIFAQTIDWVAEDYGPLSYRRPGDKSDKETVNTNVIAKTPKGSSYAYLRPDKSGSYVTQFLRLSSETVDRKTIKGVEQVMTSNRAISLFSSFIVVDGKPICDVDLEFREPDSVERRAFPAE